MLRLDRGRSNWRKVVCPGRYHSSEMRGMSSLPILQQGMRSALRRRGKWLIPNQNCQKEAWNRGHKHECKSLRSLVNKDLPKAVLACMELLTRRKHGLISDDEWTLVCQLQTHIDDFKRTGAYENIELMAMGASQFSLTQNMFNKDFVAHMYARVCPLSICLNLANVKDPHKLLDSHHAHSGPTGLDFRPSTRSYQPFL